MIVRDDLRADARGSAPSARSRRRTRRRCRGSRGRRCAGRATRWSPAPMQNVFFSSAPHASTGRANRAGTRDRARHVSARAPQHRRRAGDDARRPSRRTGVDVAVVQQEQIGDVAEPPQRLVVRRYAIGSSERLPDVITSGRAGIGQQQVMQRRVRQQQADHAVARRDRIGASGAPARFAHEHDRPLDATCSSRALRRRRIASASASREVRDHDRKRLLVAPLALAQPPDGAAPTSRRRPDEIRRCP